MTAPNPNELYRFSQIAYDVGLIFGSTTDQSLDRARRMINRAAVHIAGKNRRWSWLRKKDSLLTIASEPEYSLPDDFKREEQFWIQEGSRQKLDRISTRRKTELAPDATLVTGTPRLYDYEGVDSSGAKIVTFYPVPASSDLEIWFRYSRYLLPIINDDTDVRSYWGMPPEVIELLIQKASALALQGVNSDKYFALNKATDDAIDAAYAEDQSNPDATYQARLQGEVPRVGEGLLPPEYGRG